MTLHLKEGIDSNTREDLINNFASLLGMELYERCQETISSSRIKQIITISLCIAYCKKFIGKYIKNLEYGRISITLAKNNIDDLIEIAKSSAKYSQESVHSI